MTFIQQGHNYNITLDETTHIYTCVDLSTGETKQADLSFTQLQKELGLTPDYKEVSEEVLKNAAKRGTECHKALEELRTPNTDKVLLDYIDNEYYELIENTYTKLNEQKQFTPLVLEQKVMLELEDGRLCCGSIDELGIRSRKINKPCLYILDNKFTYEMHNVQVNTQTFFYELAVSNLINNRITINDFDFGKYYFSDEIEYSEIDRYCNHKGNIYRLYVTDDETKDELVHFNISDLEKLEEGLAVHQINKQELELSQINTLTLLAQEQELCEYQNKVKEIEKQIAINRAKIQKAMEEAGVKSYELGNVKYTLVAESVRTSFDSTKAKKYLTEEQIEECQKQTKVKASLRISVK